MTALGFRKTAWQGLSARDRQLLRALSESVGLGQPAEFEAGGGAKWFVFEDHRFRHVEIAYFACAVANLGDVPAGYTIPEKDVLDEDGAVVRTETDYDQLRADAKNFVENPSRTNPFVHPRDLDLDVDNPWQTIVSAQGAPASLQMGSVPDTWTPVVGVA